MKMERSPSEGEDTVRNPELVDWLGTGAGGQMGPPDQALLEEARRLSRENRKMRLLERVTDNIAGEMLLDDILESVYRDFREIIPYQRIGVALIDPDGETVRSHWAKSSQAIIQLKPGYAAPLAGSSLLKILETRQPRIINDLAAYLAQKPQSASTRLMVEDGFRSSLTCPLFVQNAPVGFIFFSSVEPNTYSDQHTEDFQRIARRLSLAIERGRMSSELARQKAEIEVKNAELEQLNKLKNALIGMAAHDLRDPLAMIEMAASMMLDGNLLDEPKQRRDVLESILQQVSHMLGLLEDLLDVSRLEAGKLEINPRFVSVHDFLEATAQRHGRLASSKGTRIVAMPSPHGTVLADPMRLRQVIDNLVSNAVKFSPPASIVRIGAEPAATGWRFSVQDEGPGLTEDDRLHLFEEFSQLSARPTGDERSIGLGLAITRRVVTAHGGEIGVDSEAGQGATFWFIIPYRQGHHHERPEAADG